MLELLLKSLSCYRWKIVATGEEITSATCEALVSQGFNWDLILKIIGNAEKLAMHQGIEFQKETPETDLIEYYSLSNNRHININWTEGTGEFKGTAWLDIAIHTL
jgi:hypothetical protein